MSKLRTIRAALVAFAMPLAALTLAALPAAAAPVAGITAGAGIKAAETTPIVRVHGWHRHCAWGPVRYHRHVPGVGNVACGRRPIYHGYVHRPYVYVPRVYRRHYYRPHVVVRPYHRRHWR